MKGKKPTKQELETALEMAQQKELEWRLYCQELRDTIENFSSNPPTRPPQPPKH